MPELTELAWAAGFFDGEGHVGIYVRQRGAACRLRVEVSQVDLRPLERLRAMFGGTIVRDEHRDNPRRAPMYLWKVAGKAACHALRLMLSYLVVKREAAELAIKFQTTITRGNRPLAQCEVDERRWFKAAIEVLNKRGVPKGNATLPPKPESPQMRFEVTP